MMRLCLVVLLVVVCLPARAEWLDWWQTKEQQAQTAFQAGDIETLKKRVPNDSWKAVAEHEEGEFEKAATTFESVARSKQLDGQHDSANSALYNQAVSQVRAGQYEKAVDNFEKVLEHDSEYTDAAHNRDIAQQLLEQQEQEQQQEQQQGDGEGQDEGQDSDNNSSDESEGNSESASGDSDDQESQSDEQQDQQAPSDEPQDAQQNSQGDNEPGEEGQSGEPDEGDNVESEQQKREQEQAAIDALEAEARAAEEQQSEASKEQGSLPEIEQAMSESEQATEQWLRRIPDDPAGLLRRKLEQSHRVEYPQVRNAQDSW